MINAKLKRAMSTFSLQIVRTFHMLTERRIPDASKILGKTLTDDASTKKQATGQNLTVPSSCLLKRRNQLCFGFCSSSSFAARRFWTSGGMGWMSPALVSAHLVIIGPTSS